MLTEIIKCHGSGNEFVMIDLTAENAAAPRDLGVFARELCGREESGRCDGALYVAPVDGLYAMRMFNPDGSEAEMCGNGIRCVARLVDERYLRAESFTLLSGGRRYPACRAERIAPDIPTYGVDIEVRTSSDDFGFTRGAGRFVAEVIPSLESPLRFTALNLGNPHIVAEVERIDMRELERMGEAVARLGKDFPHGINVSMYERRGPQSLFAATFERGAGITYSCGTAMTACSTAATLTGACREGEPIEVYNRGGMVRCLCRASGGRIVTRLTGNATYEWFGAVEHDASGIAAVTRTENRDDETAAYDRFVRSINAQ